MMKSKLLLFTLMATFLLHANDGDKFIYGGNIGVKFANKYNAIRYIGAYQAGTNVSQLENFFNIPNNYQNVRTLLGNKDFSFLEFSQIYRYQPAILFGVMVGYQTSPNLSFDLDLNFISLKTVGGYTLEVIDPGNTTTQEIFKNGFVSGKESRFNGRVNMNYTFDGDKARLIIGLSGLFMAWRMDENIVELDGSILTNLYSKFNPENDFSIKVSGTGFGGGFNLGVSYPLSEKGSIQLLYQPYISRLDYFTTKIQIEAAGTDYIKPKFRLDHDLVARFVF